MTTEQIINNTELADIIGHGVLDMRIISALAGDRNLNAREVDTLKALCDERGDEIYVDVLNAVANHTFSPKQSHDLWFEIMSHRKSLSETLNRDVGISVAAHDYLVNIVRLIKNTSVIEEHKLTAITNVASRDGLTSLYDQSTFKYKLSQELERSQRYGGHFSLIMFDIDHFKKVNDKLGHLAGDKALKRIADIVIREIRSIDIAARYGGEEFAVILPENNLDDAFIFAERLRKAIEKGFSEWDFPITISAGVSNSIDSNGTSDDMISKADEQLYMAKNSGRNRVCMNKNRVVSKH